MTSGHTVEELLALVEAAPEWTPPAEPEALPLIVITDRPLRDKTEDARRALVRAHDLKPEVFIRAGQPSRVTQDENGAARIDVMDESAVRGALDRSADWVKLVTRQGEAHHVSVSPPLDVTRDLMSLGRLPGIKPLIGVVESPPIRENGTVATSPGYDPATQLYYVPATGLQIPPVSEAPSAGDVATAVQQIKDPLQDFPFEDQASFANMIAIILTPVLRPLFNGPTPIAVISKPQAGVGASLLTNLISETAQGRPAPMLTFPGGRDADTEMTKKLFSLAMEGRQIIPFDNVSDKLASDPLALFVTANTVQGRLLGSSKMIDAPQRAFVIVTGNNIKLGGDIMRRCVESRLITLDCRPWERTGFKYPRLIAWVRENRGQLLGAIYTLARAWVVAGKPAPRNAPVMGSFEDWVQTIGGILEVAGVPGFLGNMRQLYDRADAEDGPWAAFLGAWREALGNQAVTAAQVCKALQEPSFAALGEVLPDDVSEGPDNGLTRRLGNALAKREGKIYPNRLRLERAGEAKRAVRWRVAEAPVSGVSLASKLTLPQTAVEQAEHTPEGELGEFTSPLSRFSMRNGNECKEKDNKEKGPQLTHLTHTPTASGQVGEDLGRVSFDHNSPCDAPFHVGDRALSPSRGLGTVDKTSPSLPDWVSIRFDSDGRSVPVRVAELERLDITRQIPAANGGDSV